jgi:hypothetical protein
MTANDKPAAHPHKDSISPPVDAVFDFSVTEWLDAPLYVSDLPETSPETNLRAMTEQEYRKSTTPSNWHRYFILGRYAVDGFTFDASMDDIVADPLKIHCIVWYNYLYHIDHSIDIPAPLLNWATLRSHQYLCSHADSALIIDTKKVTWKHYARIHSLSDNWSTAQAKNRKTKTFVPKIWSPHLPPTMKRRLGSLMWIKFLRLLPILVLSLSPYPHHAARREPATRTPSLNLIPKRHLQHLKERIHPLLRL